MSAAEIAAINPDEHFTHYLTVTRPEMTTRAVSVEKKLAAANPQFELARQIAAKAGIVMPTISQMKRKR